MNVDNKPEEHRLEDMDKNSEIMPAAGTPDDAPIPHHLTALRTIIKFRRGFMTGMAASCGAMYVGYTYQSLSNIVANAGFVHQFGTIRSSTGAVALNAQYVSIWGAVQIVAQICFQLLSPLVLDRFGRKWAMWGLLFWMLIQQAIVIEIVATSWKTYAVAKMFSGFSSGWMGPAIMTYMSEISMPEYRGALLALFAVSFKIGTFANAIACQIVNVHWPLEYRRVFYSEFVMVGIFGTVCVYLPESPMWLIRKKKHDQAKKSLRRIFGHVDGWDLDEYHAKMINEVCVSENIGTEQQGDWKALFLRVNLKRCVAASLPFTGQLFSGTAYIGNYTTYFFELAGVTQPFLGNVILQLITLLTLFVSLFLVERVGRRRLLLCGLAGCATINFLIGGFGFLAVSSQATGGVLITFCCLWEVSSSLSLGPIGWLALVEVSSFRLRAKTAAFAVLMNSFAGLVFTYTVPLLLSAQYAGWGQKIGLLFGGLSVFYFLPCYFLYPETKGRTYAELDELYHRGITPRRFAQTKTSLQETAHGVTAATQGTA